MMNTDKAPNTLTAEQAAAQGYRALTAPFFVKKESALLAAVVSDMVRGGIEHALIEESPGRVAVWRKGWIELPNPAHTVCRGIRGARD